MKHKTRFIRYFLFLILALPALTIAADATVHNLRVVDEHIIPAYEQLAASTAELKNQANRFCEQPDAAGLTSVQQEFHRSMDAWQAIQHVRFGPVEFLLRYNRFQLWPDKRGNVDKHLARLLASQDQAALEMDAFSHGSVAVQGFSALERVLFEANSHEDFATDNKAGAYRCAVLKTITANLATMGSGIAEQWVKGELAYRNFIASAEQGNDFYESSAAVSSLLLNNFYTALQVVVDQKFDRPLGTSPEDARGSRAESWRSARSLRNIRINLSSLQDFYAKAFAPRLADQELTQAINQAFTASLKTLESITLPIDQAVMEPAARQTVINARMQASELKNLVGGALPQQLDIPLGFNSLDGD